MSKYLSKLRPDLAPSKIDEVSGDTLTYVGYTFQHPLNTSAPVWRIKKIEKSGNVTTISLCDGDEDFDNVWDDRASLNYY